MKKKQLNLGFIGGSIDSAVGITHKISSQMDSRWKLVAGCFSTNVNMNFETANSWGVLKDRTYKDWQTLLKKERNRLDAIVILTPTPTHANIAIECIKNGYAVICEKALASSAKEAQKIREIVEKYNGYLTVTYNYTGYPMIRELQAVIRKGHLGRLNHIQIEMPQEGFLRLDANSYKPKPQSWRLKDGKIPTVSLDLAVHLHHMVDFLTGQKPVELVAKNNSYGYFEELVDNTMCIARYTNNLDCQFWFGKTALGNTNGLRVRVFGSKGSAEWYQIESEVLVLHDNQGRKKLLERSSVDLEVANDDRYNRFKAGHPAGFIEAFANLYFDLADSVLEYQKKGHYTSPLVFGSDIAEEGLLMLEAMASSAKTHSWEVVQKRKVSILAEAYSQ